MPEVILAEINLTVSLDIPEGAETLEGIVPVHVVEAHIDPQFRDLIDATMIGKWMAKTGVRLATATPDLRVVTPDTLAALFDEDGDYGTSRDIAFEPSDA